MKVTNIQYYILFLAIISFLLFAFLFKWIDYLIDKKYIIECFVATNENENESEETSHTVDLPLTNTSSCQNFCSPTARCAITGQQCMDDIDCPGCNPQKPKSDSKEPVEIVGNDSAGKLTFNSTPRYSILTTDIGTKSKTFSSKKFKKPPSADFGINTWRDDMDTDQKMFDKRYKPKPGELEYMPKYPKRYSATGEFIEEGPLASNAVL